MAKRSNVSVSIVIRYCSLLAIPKPTHLPVVLGIDEYRECWGARVPSHHNQLEKSFCHGYFT